MRSERAQKHSENFNEALPIFQRMNMSDAAKLTMNNIGLAWSDLGEKREGARLLPQALPLLRTAGDRSGEAP